MWLFAQWISQNIFGPLSAPPVIVEEEIQIAQLESDYEYQYRVGLAERYGNCSSPYLEFTIILNSAKI